jgi:hypothetical protein
MKAIRSFTGNQTGLKKPALPTQAGKGKKTPNLSTDELCLLKSLKEF